MNSVIENRLRGPDPIGAQDLLLLFNGNSEQG